MTTEPAPRTSAVFLSHASTGSFYEPPNSDFARVEVTREDAALYLAVMAELRDTLTRISPNVVEIKLIAPRPLTFYSGWELEDDLLGENMAALLKAYESMGPASGGFDDITEITEIDAGVDWSKIPHNPYADDFYAIVRDEGVSFYGYSGEATITTGSVDRATLERIAKPGPSE